MIPERSSQLYEEGELLIRVPGKEKEVVTYEFQREFLINLEIPNENF